MLSRIALLLGVAAAGPLIGSFGLDLTAQDRTVKPGNDFYSYHAFLDVSAIQAAGLKPEIPAIQAITFAQTYADIATLMGRPDLLAKSPMHLTIDTDAKNPDRYLTTVRQGGLGLPDRDFYLNPDGKFQEIRTGRVPGCASGS
jgi:putative endopeptidase